MLASVHIRGMRMPKYVIEREIPGAGNLTDAQLREVSQKSVNVLKGMGPEIQWLHSYVTGDKVYCVYLARDNYPGARQARRPSCQSRLRRPPTHRPDDRGVKRSLNLRSRPDAKRRPFNLNLLALDSARFSFGNVPIEESNHGASIP
jgi:hypothetical protein